MGGEFSSDHPTYLVYVNIETMPVVSGFMVPQIVIDVCDRHLETYPPPDTIVWTTEAGGFLKSGTFGRTWRRSRRIIRRETMQNLRPPHGWPRRTDRRRLEAIAESVRRRNTGRDPQGFSR